MEFTRRGFLQFVGLGAASLTIPKPLDIVMARMEDLRRPPLHVGYAAIGPMSDADRIFMFDRIMIGAEQAPLTLKRYQDLCEHWSMSLLYHFPESPDRITNFVSTRVEYVMAQKPHHFWHPYGLSKPYVVAPDQIWSLYIVPTRPDAPPKFPLPRLRLAFSGVMKYMKEDGRMMRYIRPYEVKRVALDRAEAIRLGLSGPDEPTLQEFHEKPDPTELDIAT